MSKISHDINDDEIRIISSNNTDNAIRRHEPNRKSKFIVIASILSAILCLAGIICAIHYYHSDNTIEKLELVTAKDNVDTAEAANTTEETDILDAALKGYVSISDTIINKAGLSIFTPINAVPTLHIGTDILNDSSALFIVQAADIRNDNGGIVGAFVKDGELISKGQAKSGFCAIIGEKLTVGVAEATPFLEQALENNGCFFRQYPLVVANQIVENKPKGKALRKALAELNGLPVVIMSKDKMTFHNFSQSLVELGVTNAIYLVGGGTYGFAIGPEGEKTEFGKAYDNMAQNTNYLVWRQVEQ